ncbi:MAG: ATP-binding cassette domain-containing protein [Coriobacteriales bacterium]|nr:ATP-binding cassette domain-containing protein [Coriobacteriales bacterium]
MGDNINTNALIDLPYAQLLREHPLAAGFFEQVGLEPPAPQQSTGELIATLDEFQLADCGMDAPALQQAFVAYVGRMESIARAQAQHTREIRILGGVDKDGAPEELDLCVHAGEMVCIVGPTGSGKSRLLEDIEYLAQGDTPTRRRILVDGAVPSQSMRFAVENKVTAQLSQSMVFVMDLAANDFLALHAASRMMDPQCIPSVVERTLACANDLAGEPFTPSTRLTSLSGGQSRALMIADLAFISSSPIVLIDEIENAGVDRRRALDLLCGQDKIVFVVTHDPLIALMGCKRLVIGNGAVRSIIEPDDAERTQLRALCTIDEELSRIRHAIRSGERVAATFDAAEGGGKEGGP